MSLKARSEQWLERALFILALGSTCAALWFVLSTIMRSPGPSPVEVEQYWEAGRIRRGLALYTDPLVGAFEDGAPPTRKYVLYTPIWPAILAVLPERASIVTMRLLVALGWLVGLPFLVCAFARLVPREREGFAWPPLSVSVAMLASSFCLLSRSAWCAAADAPAALLAGVALYLTVKHGRVTLLAASIFAVAPFLKPNVCMISLTCLGLDVVRHRTKSAKPLFVAALSGGIMMAICHLASHGAWLVHLRMSTVQPLLWVKWHEWIVSYMPFLGLPHLIVAACGSWLVVRARRSGELRERGVWYVLASSMTTLGFSSWLMGKAGAGTHYFIEPTVAMASLVGVLPTAPSEGGRVFGRALGLVFAILSLIVGLPLLVVWARDVRAFEESVRRVQNACNQHPGTVMLSSSERLEWALGHRIVLPEYQSTFLTHAGKLPLDVWTDTLLAPEVRCFVLEGDLPAEPPVTPPGFEPPSVWLVEASPVLRANFTLVDSVGNYRIFIKK